MNPKFMALAMLISLLIFPNQLHADVNAPIIVSTHSYSEGGESGIVHAKPFNPTAVAAHLLEQFAKSVAAGARKFWSVQGVWSAWMNIHKRQQRSNDRKIPLIHCCSAQPHDQNQKVNQRLQI